MLIKKIHVFVDEEIVKSVSEEDDKSENEITKYAGEGTASKTSEPQKVVLREITDKKRGTVAGQLSAEKYSVLSKEFLEKENINEQKISELLTGEELVISVKENLF